jgi:glutaminase
VGSLTGSRMFSPQAARRISAVKTTHGHHDATGTGAFQVGRPGESGMGGVGGGIPTITHQHRSIAVRGAGPFVSGNSPVAALALESL